MVAAVRGAQCAGPQRRSEPPVKPFLPFLVP